VHRTAFFIYRGCPHANAFAAAAPVNKNGKAI